MYDEGTSLQSELGVRSDVTAVTGTRREMYKNKQNQISLNNDYQCFRDQLLETFLSPRIRQSWISL
jgi:hypothetical protein